MALFREHFPPGSVLLNRLASSETGPIAAYYADHETEIEGSIIPVGYPVDACEVLLLDESGDPVETGVPGEIAVRTPALTPGYWQDEALTAERFLPGPDGGGPIFLTGDLGVLRPDGCLVHLGRIDSQVKIRGHRVEVAEVELALLEHPAVKEAVVVDHEDSRQEKRLVAYLVSQDGRPLAVDDLRAALLSSLPDYMVPSTFVTLEALPLTATGKVDRGALPAPAMTRPDLGTAFVSPQDVVQERLVEIWQELLGLDSVGVQDDFFELGGTSLLAARLMLQIEEEFGRVLPMALLLQGGATIEHVARAIGEDSSSSAWSSLVPIQPRGTRPPLFCVHGIRGNVVHMRHIALGLGDDQPFFGIQPRGLDGVEEPFTRIEDMASYYIDVIRTLQPQGPYYLSGYSFGGVIAFEMAHQLLGRGEEVALLLMFDTRFPGPKIQRGRRTPALFLWRNLLNIPHLVAYAVRLKPRQLFAFLRGKARNSLRWLLRRETEALVNQQKPLSRYSMIVRDATRQAAVGYVLKPYPGKLTYVFASLDAEMLVRTDDDPDLRWADYALGGMDVVRVPGTHGSMISPPQVRDTARMVRAILDSLMPGERAES